MLFLTFKPSEGAEITLPDGRKGRLVFIGNNRARGGRIAFDFPHDVKIMRETAIAKRKAEEARQ